MNKQVILIFLAMIATGCGKSVTQSQFPDSGPPITINEVTGTPSNFGGTWKGTCTLMANGAMLSPCALSMQITQTNTSLSISANVVAGAQNQQGNINEYLTISQNDLINGAPIGSIGAQAFTFKTASGEFRFLMTGADHATVYATNSSGSSSLTVESHVIRGAGPLASGRR